jgi:hypothetical protein
LNYNSGDKKLTSKYYVLADKKGIETKSRVASMRPGGMAPPGCKKHMLHLAQDIVLITLFSTGKERIRQWQLPESGTINVISRCNQYFPVGPLGTT